MKPTISNSFFILFLKLITFVGLVISFFYFVFYVHALPKINDFSELIHYVITIACVGLFILILFVAFSIWPSLYLSIFQQEIRQKYKIAITFVLFITPIFVFVRLLLIHYSLDNPIVTITNLVLIFIITLFFMFKKNEKFPYFLFLFLIGIVYATAPVIHFSSLLLLQISQNEFEYWYAFVISFLFFMGIIYTNHRIVIYGYTDFFKLPIDFFPDPLNKTKKTFILVGLYSLGLLFALSVIFITMRIDNLFITMPFKILKLGNYSSELEFDKSYIQDYNPFPLNKNLENKNVFYILNSLGNDYIIKEIGGDRAFFDVVIYEKNSKTISKMKLAKYIDKRGNEFLIYKDKTNDQYYGWNLKNTIRERTYNHENFIKTNEFNLNHEKYDIQRYLKDHSRTYRIKQEYIKGEIILDNVSGIETDWKE